jgi:hypothetical protein
MLNRALSCFILLGLANVIVRDLQATEDPARLVIIKVDGLSPFVLDAAVDPSSPSTEKLPYPQTWRLAYQETTAVLSQSRLLPNIDTYFYRHGARVEAMYTGTLAVSGPSWAMIDTGQASIVKTNSYFNRFSGHLTSYLDQLRESMSTLVRGAGRTAPLWQLDLLGVPIMLDSFPEDRAWASVQTLYRNRPAEQLSKLTDHLVRAGEQTRNPLRWLRKHLNNRLIQPDYPEMHDAALADLTSRKILEKDASGRERYDVISVIFASVDHQFHVDPNYRNLQGWLVRLDDWIGQILAAVELSERRDKTTVVLLSDHGLDFNPLLLNFSYPINPWLRRVQFGSHSVIAPVAEDHEHAITVPVRGVDFNRVYESDSSPYGPAVPFGEKGYVTAFTANNGNPRFDAYFRNSDLNRLHLLLLEARRLGRDSEALEVLYPVFLEAHREVRSWLEPEITRSETAAEAFEARVRQLAGLKDPRSEDEVRRLQQEVEAYRKTAAKLRKLSALPTSRDEWLSWAGSRFKISELIPKGYWGPPNNLKQLRHYVVGWETPPNARWQEGVPTFQTLDYLNLFPGVEASSPNARGERRPFNFLAASLPVTHIQPHFARPLRQAIWLVFAEERGEAMVLESEQGELFYQGGIRYDTETSSLSRAARESGDGDQDPLGYGPLEGRWMSPRNWASETVDLEANVVPVILAELFRKNYLSFLPTAGANEARATRVSREALEFHFEQQIADFRVWTNRGWNVNSNSHTPGGTHGGFSPLDVRTVFAAWGGEKTGLRRGEVLPGSFFTYDITPTLLELTGRAGRPDTVDGHRYHPGATIIPLGRSLVGTPTVVVPCN